MDDKFTKKTRKQSNSSTSLNCMNSVPPSTFRKTDQGTYYFPNGEVFRPRLAPAKRNRPNKIKTNPNTSPAVAPGGFYVGSSPIASKPASTASMPPSPNPSMSRSNSITSNPGYLTKTPSLASIKMKKSDLVQSLRSTKNDTPTNILIANKQQTFPRKESFKTNNLMKHDFVMAPYDNDTLQPTSILQPASPTVKNKSLTNLSDSNPSSLSNYTLNRSATNTPQTSINTSSDDGDGAEEDKFTDSETFLPKVNEEPIPTLDSAATIDRIESSDASIANETIVQSLAKYDRTATGPEEAAKETVALQEPSETVALQKPSGIDSPQEPSEKEASEEMSLEECEFEDARSSDLERKSISSPNKSLSSFHEKSPSSTHIKPALSAPEISSVKSSPETSSAASLERLPPLTLCVDNAPQAMENARQTIENAPPAAENAPQVKILLDSAKSTSNSEILQGKNLHPAKPILPNSSSTMQEIVTPLVESIILTESTTIKSTILPGRAPVKSMILPEKAAVKSMILPEKTAGKYMVLPEKTTMKPMEHPTVHSEVSLTVSTTSSDLTPPQHKNEAESDSGPKPVPTGDGSIQSTVMPLPQSTSGSIQSTIIALPQSTSSSIQSTIIALPLSDPTSSTTDSSKPSSPDFPEPTIVDSPVETSQSNLSIKADKFLVPEDSVSSTIVTNGPNESSNPATPQRAYFDFENNDQFKNFIGDGQTVPPRGDVEIVGEKVRYLSERSTSSISTNSRRNSSINGLLSPSPVPRSPLSTAFDHAGNKVDPNDGKSVTHFAYPPPILDQQLNNDKSLPPSPVKSMSSSVSSPNKLLSPSPLNNNTPPSPPSPVLAHKSSIASSMDLRKFGRSNSFVRSTSTNNFKSMFKKIFKNENNDGGDQFSNSVMSLARQNSMASDMESVDTSPSPKVKMTSPFLSSDSLGPKTSRFGKTKKVFSLSGLKSKKSNTKLNEKVAAEADNKPLPDINFRKSLLFTLEDFTLTELPDIATDNTLFEDVLNDFDAKLNDQEQSPIKLHEVLGSKKTKSTMNDPFLNDDELTRDQIEDQRKKDLVGESQDSLPQDDKQLSRSNSNDLYIDDNIRYLQQEVVWTIDNDGELKAAEQPKRITKVDDIDSDNDTQTIIVRNDELVEHYQNLNDIDRTHSPMHLRHVSQFQDFDSLEISIKKFEYLRNVPLQVNVPDTLSPILKKQDSKAASKKVGFSNKIFINETFPPEMYKRYNKSVTQYNLTESSQFIHIKNEINFFKCNEMLVHEHSQNNTHFFY